MSALQSGCNNCYGVLTDASGSYSVQIPADTYTITVTPQTLTTLGAVPQAYNLVASEVALNTNTSLNITIPAKKVTVHLQDSVGNPVANMHISPTVLPTNNSLLMGSYPASGSNTGSNNAITDTSGNGVFWLFPTDGNSGYTFTVSPGNGYGAAAQSDVTFTADTTITIIVPSLNQVPSVSAINAPSSLVLVGTSFTASASFTDPNVSDTHTASWNWGDGNTTVGTVTESNGSGSISNSHTYTATGVYTITLTVSDQFGGIGTSTYQYVTAYVPTSSFAGGRSFNNPSGAYPTTSGKVTFGVSAKYSNSNVLTGSVKMNFKAANIDFASTSLQSLTTSNGKAYLTGTGTVNGSGTYTYLAVGSDGSVTGGQDLIRLQIKNSSGTVIYDSQPGAGDTADPTTLVQSGNVRVN